MAWKVTIDNGSTFTDGCLLTETGALSVKVLTTPYDLMSCFIEVFRALARAAGLPGEAELLRRVGEVRYSTTAGTNALLVRKGVRVGLVVDRDAAAGLYGLRSRAPEMIDTIVGARVVGLQPCGDDPEELDRALLAAVHELNARGAQSIVVSLSGARGAELERVAKGRYIKLMPGHLLAAFPTLFSRELCADPDDARRTATGLLNAFLHHDMAAFLYHADNWLRERHVEQPLRIMRNDQGCGRVAKTTAVKTLDSGPMGGLLGAAALSRRIGAARVVTMDVGGTSTDFGLVENHRPLTELFGNVHELPLSFSLPALRTAALGGGSIVRVRNGRVQIGPESAGALPGPACFGRGGQEPTLTDAALLAGYLQAQGFAAGALSLQENLAERAILEHVAKPLGLRDARAGAWAVLEAFSLRAGETIGAILKHRQWKPEEVALVCYGGSGPLLACIAAAHAGIRNVVIPPHSSNFSAMGVAFSELAHEYRWIADSVPAGGGASRALETLRERATRDMFGEGVGSNETTVSIRLHTNGSDRYLDSAENLASLLEGASGTTVLDYRLAKRASAETKPLLVQRPRGAGAGGSGAQREVLVAGERRSVALVAADGVCVGDSGAGPCLLESPYWSAMVPGGWQWTLSEDGFRLAR